MGHIKSQPAHFQPQILERKLGNEYVFYMLYDAIDLSPPAKLHKMAKKYLDLKRLRPDAASGCREADSVC